jgi:DNA-binding LacI/PurR family transcriptional regulator
VACNDEVALDCIDLLVDMGIRVPDQVSVVGFDDGHSASSYDLTTYNFNGHAALHALLNHLLRYNTAQARRPFAGIEEAEGYIVNRGTLGPPSR